MLRVIPAAVAVLLACSLLLGRPSARPAPVGDLNARSVPGELVLGVDPGLFGLVDAALGTLLGGEIAGRLPEVQAVRLRLGTGETLARAADRLRGMAGVRYVESNVRLETTGVPNDPLYSTQSTYLTQIEATQAWDIEEGRDSVLVAVLDTGVDVSHEDLQGKTWVNPFEIPGNSLDDDRNGCVDDVHGCSYVSSSSVDPGCTAPPSGDIQDDNGHGTFVAGIIAAEANDGVGVTGAAPGVTILPVKILDCQGGGTAFDAAPGLLYAARVGARVANISFAADAVSNTLANAIRTAHDSYGMVVVAATGNEGASHVAFPATLPEVIAVGSSGTPADDRVRSPFSDWGPEVTVVAPGLNIISTVPFERCEAWQCVPGEPYALASGTSFASPFVSALAALILSRYPNTPPAAVARMITSPAERLNDGDSPGWFGAGRIRMRNALNLPRYSLGTPGLTRQ